MEAPRRKSQVYSKHTVLDFRYDTPHRHDVWLAFVSALGRKSAYDAIDVILPGSDPHLIAVEHLDFSDFPSGLHLLAGHDREVAQLPRKGARTTSHSCLAFTRSNFRISCSRSLRMSERRTMVAAESCCKLSCSSSAARVLYSYSCRATSSSALLLMPMRNSSWLRA